MSFAQATIWNITLDGFSADDITELITIRKSFSEYSSTDNAIRIDLDVSGRCCWKGDVSASTLYAQSKCVTMRDRRNLKDWAFLVGKAMIEFERFDNSRLDGLFALPAAQDSINLTEKYQMAYDVFESWVIRLKSFVMHYVQSGLEQINRVAI